MIGNIDAKKNSSLLELEKLDKKEDEEGLEDEGLRRQEKLRES